MFLEEPIPCLEVIEIEPDSISAVSLNSFGKKTPLNTWYFLWSVIIPIFIIAHKRNNPFIKWKSFNWFKFSDMNVSWEYAFSYNR